MAAQSDDPRVTHDLEGSENAELDHRPPFETTRQPYDALKRFSSGPQAPFQRCLRQPRHSESTKECQMDIHPWTKYEIARMRDEERLLRARAAVQARELRRSDVDDVDATARSWLDRILRRGAVAGRTPARTRVEGL
jgi:hypothetical protein